jgi:hypothetical protein
MIEGKYLYCILEGAQNHHFNEVGLLGKQVHTIPYKDISAVLSNASFKEMKPDVETITSHQRVIEESRMHGTTLPARFGTMFKSNYSVKNMLTKTYKDLKSKITYLKDKDEFGIKIMIDRSDLNKLKLVSQDNPEIKKIKKEIASSGKGTAYFLKMKMDEAVRNETYKRIDQLSGQIHRELAGTVQQNCLLKTDFDQIILNAAYLVNRDDITKFRRKLDDLKEKHEKNGLIFHMSGPWAPYSFC